jgi:hypothetical protein
LTVPDQKSFERIPDVPGLLSYRTDDKQLYVNQGSKWQALSTEQEVSLGSGNNHHIGYTQALDKMHFQAINLDEIQYKLYSCYIFQNIAFSCIFRKCG